MQKTREAQNNICIFASEREFWCKFHLVSDIHVPEFDYVHAENEAYRNKVMWSVRLAPVDSSCLHWSVIEEVGGLKASCSTKKVKYNT